MQQPAKAEVKGEQGAVELTATNLVNGREGRFHANPKWTMEKVKEHAYQATHDRARPADRFTCTNENVNIEGALLQLSYEAFTSHPGTCPGERHFYVRGPVGGA